MMGPFNQSQQEGGRGRGAKVAFKTAEKKVKSLEIFYGGNVWVPQFGHEKGDTTVCTICARKFHSHHEMKHTTLPFPPNVPQQSYIPIKKNIVSGKKCLTPHFLPHQTKPHLTQISSPSFSFERLHAAIYQMWVRKRDGGERTFLHKNAGESELSEESLVKYVPRSLAV